MKCRWWWLWDQLRHLTDYPNKLAPQNLLSFSRKFLHYYFKVASSWCFLHFSILIRRIWTRLLCSWAICSFLCLTLLSRCHLAVIILFHTCTTQGALLGELATKWKILNHFISTRKTEFLFQNFRAGHTDFVSEKSTFINSILSCFYSSQGDHYFCYVILYLHSPCKCSALHFWDWSSIFWIRNSISLVDMKW